MSKERESVNLPIRNITKSGHPKLRENPPEPSLSDILKEAKTPAFSKGVEKSKINRVDAIKKLNSNKYRRSK